MQEVTQSTVPEYDTLMDKEAAISFRCAKCGQEIMAPENAAGCEAECPFCETILRVPSTSDPGTTFASGAGIGDIDPAQLKKRTIRIDVILDDDKPTAPSKQDEGSDAMKSRTMRIDLPEGF